MEIKIKNVSFDELLDEPKASLLEPRKPAFFWKHLIYILSSLSLKMKGFKYQEINLTDELKKQPCVVVMNHGSFIDMMIAAKILKFHSYNTITMNEAFIGRKDFLPKLGCFPIHKFIYSPKTIVDSIKLVKENNQSVLIFPEGAYSFDGTSSPLPPQFGKFVKTLNIPVLFIKTRGAHLTQPLFNRLKKRKVKLSATIECLLSKDEVNKKSDKEIFDVINNRFKDINYYKEQLEDKVLIKNVDRADYLESVLYKCPHCLKEGKMEARGSSIKCLQCGEEYILNEDGTLANKKGNNKFTSIPEWYKWERECVRNEILENKYHEEYEGKIYAAKNYDQLYLLKEIGHLVHNMNDVFTLKIGDRLLSYNYKSCYTINSDLFFYSVGDVVSVGDHDTRYYVSPINKFNGIVTKIRFAVEEKYKLANQEIKQ